MAIHHYFTEYKKSLLDIVRSKASYKNYRDFVLKLLEVCECMYVCVCMYVE